MRRRASSRCGPRTRRCGGGSASSRCSYFKSPAAAKTEIRKLLAEAILAWGDAAPVKFAERTDAWDFEIVMRASDDCDGSGCVLASAFFPDAGRHQLVLYPKMFSQDRQEQVETLIHEIGHVFGLRHFFADVSEGAWPSQIFGTHKPFTIMNYGSQSVLTADDKVGPEEALQAGVDGRADPDQRHAGQAVQAVPYDRGGARESRCAR